MSIKVEASIESVNLGGEGDRISLALMLSFQQVHQTPFVLIDESLGSLDSDNKELCMEILRQTMANKTIFVIMHEGSEGWFDHIISL